jgi:hypothetical protein
MNGDSSGMGGAQSKEVCGCDAEEDACDEENDGGDTEANVRAAS